MRAEDLGLPKVNAITWGPRSHCRHFSGPAAKTQPLTYPQGHGQVLPSPAQTQSHGHAGGATGDTVPEGGAKSNAMPTCCFNAQPCRPEGGQRG